MYMIRIAINEIDVDIMFVSMVPYMRKHDLT